LLTPNDDDTYSPLHDEEDASPTETDTPPDTSDETAEKPA